MIVNGNSLLKMNPIEGMIPEKLRFEGTSFGLSEAGYDIRIKQDIWFTALPEGRMCVQVDNEDPVEGRFTLASATEKFTMPPNLVATIKDKSTWARKGLSVFNTVAEPGWNGWLTLELVYHGTSDLQIKAGQGIAQVLFSTLTDMGDYGDGKYQNQEDRPVKARS